MKKNLKKVERKSCGHVIRDGELTGHRHYIEEDGVAELYAGEDGTVQFMEVFEPDVIIRHNTHAPLKIEEKGEYEVGAVVEYDHFAQEARKVVD